MMDPCIIYGLLNPIDKNIFYVGMTKNKLSTRFSCHIGESKRRKTEKDMIICEIIASGKRPRVIILQQKKYPYYQHMDMAAREKYWVKEIANRGHTLTNKVYHKKIIYV